jgi:hypothetical protein
MGMSLSLVIKAVHLLALGAWSGAVLFFSFFTALPVLGQMKTWAVQPGNWLGLKTEAEGTRVAGEFLNIVFARYFPFQLVCGVVAVATALWWWQQAGVLGRIRAGLLVAALAGVAMNYWVLAPKVYELRQQRYMADAAQAEAANAAFGPAHSWSLVVDMVGWLCVVVALALYAWLPGEAGK